jgi:hypothetical protein
VDLTEKIRVLRSILGREEIRKGDELVFFCPRHKHHKPKLSVNVKTDNMHCWFCDWKDRSLLPILELKGPTEISREYKSKLSGSSETRIPEKKYDEPILPKEFRSLTSDWGTPYYHNAMEYLSSRGVSSDDIVHWKLGYCEDGDYRYRIIIPSFDEFGELNFFTGRSFYPSMRHRYMHGNFCKDIIFDEYMVDWSRPVTITEGFFDLVKIDHNGIPLQGSILNEGSRLFSKIVKHDCDTFFAMDSDAFEKQLRIIKKFLMFGVNCYYIDLGTRRDVAEMDREEFIRAKKSATAIGSDLDLIRCRLKEV